MCSLTDLPLHFQIIWCWISYCYPPFKNIIHYSLGFTIPSTDFFVHFLFVHILSSFVLAFMISFCSMTTSRNLKVWIMDFWGSSMPENHFILPVCIQPRLARYKIQASKSFSPLPSHHLLTFSVTDEKSDVNLILVLLYVISDPVRTVSFIFGVLRGHHNTHNWVSFSFILFSIWKSLEFLKCHVFLLLWEIF